MECFLTTTADGGSLNISFSNKSWGLLCAQNDFLIKTALFRKAAMPGVARSKTAVPASTPAKADGRRCEVDKEFLSMDTVGGDKQSLTTGEFLTNFVVTDLTVSKEKSLL